MRKKQRKKREARKRKSSGRRREQMRVEKVENNRNQTEVIAAKEKSGIHKTIYLPA